MRPARVVEDRGRGPLRLVERRVGHHEVRLQRREGVVEQRAALRVLDIAGEAVDREVHPADAPGRLVPLLAVDRDLVGAAAVRLDEPRRLDEQAARAAGRVEHAAFVRLEHLDQQPRDGRGREELAAPVALGSRELLDEVLIGPSEDVARFRRVRAEADLGDRLHERPHQLGGERRAGVDARQHVPQACGSPARSRSSASSMRRAMSGCDAAASSASHRALSGTQNTFSPAYSSRSSRISRGPRGPRRSVALRDRESSARARRRRARRSPRCTSGTAGRGRGACTRPTRPSRAACSPPRRARRRSGCRRRTSCSTWRNSTDSLLSERSAQRHRETRA